jgi:hypothetical protein
MDGTVCIPFGQRIFEIPTTKKPAFLPALECLRMWWDVTVVAGEGFEPSTFGLCIPLQLPLPDESVCGLDFLFTLDQHMLPLGCLPSSLYTFSFTELTEGAWLGVTPLAASPNLTGDRTEVSFCTAQCRMRSQASR